MKEKTIVRFTTRITSVKEKDWNKSFVTSIDFKEFRNNKLVNTWIVTSKLLLQSDYENLSFSEIDDSIRNLVIELDDWIKDKDRSEYYLEEIREELRIRNESNYVSDIDEFDLEDWLLLDLYDEWKWQFLLSKEWDIYRKYFVTNEWIIDTKQNLVKKLTNFEILIEENWIVLINDRYDVNKKRIICFDCVNWKEYFEFENFWVIDKNIKNVFIVWDYKETKLKVIELSDKLVRDSNNYELLDEIEVTFKSDYWFSNFNVLTGSSIDFGFIMIWEFVEYDLKWSSIFWKNVYLLNCLNSKEWIYKFSKLTEDNFLLLENVKVIDSLNHLVELNLLNLNNNERSIRMLRLNDVTKHYTFYKNFDVWLNNVYFYRRNSNKYWESLVILWKISSEKIDSSDTVDQRIIEIDLNKFKEINNFSLNKQLGLGKFQTTLLYNSATDKDWNYWYMIEYFYLDWTNHRYDTKFIKEKEIKK